MQTVRRDTNPRFHALLHAFGARTGVPVLVNTSFNVRGEPIVCTPGDAIEAFFSTPLDALAIGRFSSRSAMTTAARRRSVRSASRPAGRPHLLRALPGRRSTCARASDTGSDLRRSIVVDDGRSDDTRAAVQAGSRRGAGRAALRYLRPRRARSRGGAQLRAGARARRPIIAFTDDDTVPDADWLRRGTAWPMRAAAAPRCAAAAGGARRARRRPTTSA